MSDPSARAQQGAAARTSAAYQLVNWDILRNDTASNLIEGTLPITYENEGAYMQRLQPVLTEEIRESFRQTLQRDSSPPYLMQYSGIEDASSDGFRLTKLSYFWGRREQGDFELDQQHAGVVYTRPAVGDLPRERSCVILCTQPIWPAQGAAVPAGQTAVIGLVTKNNADYGSNNAWTLDILVSTDCLQQALEAHGTASSKDKQKALAEARARFEAKQKVGERVRLGVKRYREEKGLGDRNADGDEDARIVGLDDGEGGGGGRGGAGAGAGSLSTVSETVEPTLVPPAVLYCWTLGNASTALRELESLFSLDRLHPVLRQQVLQPAPLASTPTQSSGVDRRRYLSPDFLQHGLAKSMNPSQLEAVHGVLARDSGFSLIQGPPGSGKTTVILSLLNALHLASYARYHEVVFARTCSAEEELKQLQEAWEQQAKAQAAAAAAAQQAKVAVSSGMGFSLVGALQNAHAHAAGQTSFPKAKPVTDPTKPVNIAGSLRSLLLSTGDILSALEPVHAAHAVRPRILVTAPSNTAVDGVLTRLLDKGMKGSRLIPSHDPSMPPSLEVYRPVVRRVGEGAGFEARAAQGGVHVETEIDRLISMSQRPQELQAWVSKLHSDRNAILHDISSKRAWLHERVRADPSCLGDSLNQVASKVMRAVEAYETCKLKLRRAELISSLQSLAPREFGRARAEVSAGLRSSLLDEASVVFTTTSSAAVASMEAFIQDTGRPFSIVIVDEAAQASESSTLIPLRYGASQVVLVGDPQQLPATVLSAKAQACGWDGSLMARMASGGVPLRMLAVQYRCNPAIMQWPAAYFYAGRLSTEKALVDGARVHELHKVKAFKPLALYDVAYGSFTQGVAQLPDLQAQQGGNAGTVLPPDPSQGTGAMATSSSNAHEALVIMQLLDALAKWRDSSGKPFSGTVGLITFYRAQVQVLVQACVQLWPDPESQPAFVLDIQTVDGFQGQERDIVLLSCVRTVDKTSTGPEGTSSMASTSEAVVLPTSSEPSTEQRQGAGKPVVITARTPGSAMGFVDDPRRMNVALTRARYACWVVGQTEAMATSTHWASFVRHCTAQGCVVPLKSQADTPLAAAEKI